MTDLLSYLTPLALAHVAEELYDLGSDPVVDDLLTQVIDAMISASGPTETTLMLQAHGIDTDDLPVTIEAANA